MYPQADPREPEIGGNPASEKIRKITPEWQTEQFLSVDSAVARVKGKHHDGDVSSWMAILCRQIRWYREPFRPVWMIGLFSFYDKKAAETAPSYFYRKKQKNTKDKKTKSKIIILLRRNSKCTTKSPIT